MEIPKETKLDLYRKVLTARLLDNRLIAEFLKKPFGPYTHSAAYQEVLPVIAALLCRKDDYIKLHMRFGIFQFAKGVSMKQVVAGEMFKKMGPDKILEYRDLDLEYGIIGKSGSLGEDIPIYVGAAVAEQIKGTDRITVCIMGDGTASRGPVHEAMNVAAVWKAPIVFAISNNRYAVSTPTHQQMANPNMADRAIGYGMPGWGVDGNDVLAVYEVMDKAIKMAREGKGPSLVVSNTYRIYGHSVGDGQQYRPKGEVEEWQKFDPVPRYKKRLMDEGILTEEMASQIEKDVLEELDEAVKYARALPEPTVEDLAKFAID